MLRAVITKYNLFHTIWFYCERLLKKNDLISMHFIKVSKLKNIFMETLLRNWTLLKTTNDNDYENSNIYKINDDCELN